MAQDYVLMGYQQYSIVSGGPTSTGGPVTFGGTDTDDGFWNLGDLSTDSGTFTYQGHYVSGGHTFLIWQGISNVFIGSPTALAGDPNFPATFAALPPLITTPLATCFGQGTLIQTKVGETAVEDLKIGDLIRTNAGDLVPVKWIGRQTLHKWTHGAHMRPVRISAGALGSGQPTQDLTVTTDHGMMIDGYVINASALVNGDAIDFVPMEELDDSFTVYHIETENHDVILANGAPSETFVDAAGRTAFDNYQEYLDLYGVERIIPEMNFPRVASRRLLPTGIKARLGLVGDTIEATVSVSA